MVKKPKQPIEPDKLVQYQKIVDTINDLYIKEYFQDKLTGTEELIDPLIDDELLRLTQQDPQLTKKVKDFEIISAVRYDPQLANHKQIIADDDDDDIFAHLKFDEDDDLVSTDFGYTYAEPNDENDYNSDLFFLFNEHFHRLNLSMSYFEFQYHMDRTDLLQNLNVALEGLDKSKPYKMRVSVNRDGDVSIEAHPVAERFNLLDGLTVNSIDDYLKGGSTVWTVHIDKKPTLISPFTSFKTTNRKQYSEARARALPEVIPEGEQHEVLLHNSANHVMEGSITNVAFKMVDEKTNMYTWFTPVLTSGCLCGTVRHMLLSKGFIKEKLIKTNEIKAGDEVLLMNGVMGVVKGILVE